MSLIEILVALAVVAVLAGTVMLSLGAAGHREDAETEARRLAVRLSGAFDQVLVSGRKVALVWDQTGYGFQSNPANATDAKDGIDADMFAARHDLPQRIRLAAADAPAVVPLDADGTGPAVTFVFEDNTNAWRVVWDGLTAKAAMGRAGP